MPRITLSTMLMAILIVIILLLIALLVNTTIIAVKAQGPFVGSTESSSKAYHYTWCGHANQTKTEHIILFVDAQDAVNRGYRPCDFCHPPWPSDPLDFALIIAIIALIPAFVGLAITVISKRSQQSTSGRG